MPPDFEDGDIVPAKEQAGMTGNGFKPTIKRDVRHFDRRQVKG
jgi:hypothetical protein